jgi:hypothetical protein
MYENEAEYLMDPDNVARIEIEYDGESNAFCERAACTPFYNMYEDMDKQIPDDYNKCQPDYFCDYEYTGTCQKDVCMDWEDCVQTNYCDMSQSNTNDITFEEFPYLCKLCENHSDCPDAPECIEDVENEDYDAECNSNAFVCMETGACTQQVKQNLDAGVVVGISSLTVVFVVLVVLFILCCSVKKSKASIDATNGQTE